MARRTVTLLLTSLLLAGCSSGGSNDEEQSTGVFFGDSLSDDGSDGVRYTTVPGEIWAQIVDPDGLNYAVGGARIDGVTGQIDDFLAEYD